MVTARLARLVRKVRQVPAVLAQPGRPVRMGRTVQGLLARLVRGDHKVCRG